MAIEDVEGQKAWVESTLESEIIEKYDDSHFIFYQSTNMPFPVKDRDVVLEYSRIQNPETKTVHIEFNTIKGKMKVKDNFIRVPMSHSSYTIKSNSDGYTTFDYFIKVDVGGSLPQWLVNLAMSTSITSTIQALYDYIKSDPYNGIVLDGVEN